MNVKGGPDYQTCEHMIKSEKITPKAYKTNITNLVTVISNGQI